MFVVIRSTRSKERKEDSGAIGGIDKRLWPEDLWFVELCKEVRSINSGDVDCS